MGRGDRVEAFHLHGEMNAEGTAEGAGSWAREAGGRVCSVGCAAGGFRPPPLRRLRGCPGRSERAGSAAGDAHGGARLPGATPSQGRLQAPMAPGKWGVWAFQGTVRRRLWLRGLEASGQGW